MAASSKTRPVFLNLLRIQFPAAALASIAHRVSGVLLVLSIPLWLYLLELSLAGPAGFDHSRQILASAPVKALLVVLGWSFAHHLLAGVRVLLLDVELGAQLPTARMTARGVNALSVVVLVGLIVGVLL